MPRSRNRRFLPLLLTLLALLVVGLTGTYASTALLSDEVSLVAVQAHGGTLDLAVEETGFRARNLRNVRPGDSVSSTFTVTDTGSIDADLTFVVLDDAGTDPNGCFSYRLTEGERVWVSEGSLDRIVAMPLEAISPGAAGTRTFVLTVTNGEECATNNAAGSLAAKITAIQRAQA